MAEAEEWCGANFVVVPIPDVHVLTVQDSAALRAVAEIGGVVGNIRREGQGQFRGLVMC